MRYNSNIKSMSGDNQYSTSFNLSQSQLLGLGKTLNIVLIYIN